MSSFRSSVWDPSLIIGQMVCMQSLFYFIQCLALSGFRLSGSHATISAIFSPQTSRALVFTELIASTLCAVALVKVVQKAKQCLDFSTTMHFWHLVIVSITSATFPTQISWWLLQISSIVICTVIGEYLCMREETREIPLTLNSRYAL
ncbi:hypothetical protein AB6A40_010137 [Gnathostoma spinigerum]|uniref:Protein SYS1 homolog n=1 Tax=Gnathostoma spinigerum TaxID=75299 RepID=A0ABD6F169_9BILA